MATLSVFTEAAEYTPSDYWKQVLLEAGQGKFPASYNYRDGILTYRSKRKTAKVEKLVCPQDPQALATTVQQFLRKTSGIMSEEDQYVYAHKQDDSIQTKWSRVRSSAQRKQLLEQYVATKSKELGMSTKEREETLRTLNLGFCLGAFPSVQMSDDGSIADVEGFKFDPERRRFGFKKPKGKVRKPVETDEDYDEDHVTTESSWIKPWLRLLRTLFRLPEDGGNASALPSTTEGAPLFQKA
jgi:hypothetical protein